MGKLERLLRIELVSLIALVTSGFIFAVIAFLFTSFFQSALTPFSAGILTFMATLTIGFFPVLLIGAPSYIMLKQYNKDNWFVVLLIGLIPGLIALMISSTIDVIICAFISGVFISSVTHAYSKRFMN